MRFWWTHEDIGQPLYSLQGLRPIAAQVRQPRELGFPRWRIVQHRRPIVVRGRLLELRCRARPHLPSVTHPAQHPGSMSVCGLYIIYKSVCSMQQDIKFGFRCPKLQTVVRDKRFCCSLVCCCYLYYGANATENITLLRTLAGSGSTGVNGGLGRSVESRSRTRGDIKELLLLIKE